MLDSCGSYSLNYSKFRQINIDSIIQKLLEQEKSLQTFILKEEEIIGLCHETRKRLLSQPMLLELNAPINVCGDFHGQFDDLKEVFGCIGEPHAEQNYLFLGDYVDRGKFSLECICLLFAYKIKYNYSFFLLRGNHQCSELNQQYGFYDQCKRRSSIKVWNAFTDVFNCLPLAAVIGNRIFCVHGGISPALVELRQINKIKRPLEFDRNSLAADLLWSDPSEHNGWAPNIHRGIAFVYGPDKVEEFLKDNDFDLICRSHQVVEDGYQFLNDKKLLTIFSAPNYCSTNQNKGAVLRVEADLTCRIKQFHNILPSGIKIFRNKRSCTPLNIRTKKYSFQKTGEQDEIDTPYFGSKNEEGKITRRSVRKSSRFSIR